MVRNRVAAALIAAGLSCASSTAFAEPPQSGAEKLRRLDIMLMVTGLRCRGGSDDFMADYGRFTSSHLRELNAAGEELKDRFGERMLDRISTSMANQYGQGHPWLGCRELAMVARNLAEVRGTDTLIEAADQLLDGGSRAGNWALARR